MVGVLLGAQQLRPPQEMAQPRPTVQLAEPAAGTDFRCLACALSFGTLDELKVHYKQEFHRANLQRKVSGLGPISADEFERRAAQQDPDADEAQLDSQPAGKDKHSRKRAKEAKLKAKNDERARRHEAKMLKIQQRAQAAVSCAQQPPPAPCALPACMPSPTLGMAGCVRPPVAVRACTGTAGSCADDRGAGRGGCAAGADGSRAEAGPEPVHLLRETVRRL